MQSSGRPCALRVTCDHPATFELCVRASGFQLFQLFAINDSEAFCRDLKGKFAALAKNSVDYVAETSRS